MKGYSIGRHFYSKPTNGKYYLLLFIAWPFLAFLFALVHYSEKEAKRVVYFFLIYYGLTIVVPVGYYIDAVGYAMSLKYNSLLPFSEIFNIFTNMYSEGGSIDMIEPLLSFLVSRITTDHRVLFAVFAAIFGFFYIKTINLLHKQYRTNPNWNALIIMAFFSLIIPVTSISGFRMWTAAWIFTYSAYHVVLNRNPKYFLLTFSAVFVHWSFVTLNFILVLYYLLGNRDIIYIPLAIASFIVPYLIAPFMAIMAQQLGGAFQNRYDMYSDESYVLLRQGAAQQAAWFMRLGSNLVLYYLLFAMAIIKTKYGYLMQGRPEKNLFSFTLLLLTFVNIGKTLPSLGTRFQLVFFLFATMYVFLFFIKRPVRNIAFITWLGLFPMFLNSAIVFRQGTDTMNAWLFTPGLGIPLLVQGIPVVELLFR
jgi:hypothetical protein